MSGEGNARFWHWYASSGDTWARVRESAGRTLAEDVLGELSE
ncbi:hypothetical protein [Allokutzneria albata]|nr:hypothetical protein [Allokutzneria albata]